MLRVDNLTKSYHVTLIFEKVSFIINEGEKTGLVGINGSGKTTLLRILAGQEQADSGVIFLSPGETLGYLPQTMDFYAAETLRSVLEGAQGQIPTLRARLGELEKSMAQPDLSADQLAELLDEYGQLRPRYEAAGGDDIETRIEQVLAGLELGQLDLDRKLATLSGGQKIKIALARLLLANPSFLLLDEPTNNLDLPALVWLENYLKTYTGAVMVVSHDRSFLDRVVTQVLELNEHSHTTKMYAGNFSAYQSQKETERARWEEAYENQQEWIAKMEEDIERTKQQAVHTEKVFNSGLGSDHMRRLAKKVAKKAKAREHRLERVIEGEEKIEKPPLEWTLKLDLTSSLPPGTGVLKAQHLSWRYGSNPVFNDISLDIRSRERVAIVGRNGIGKSTLLKLLVGETHSPTGSVWLNNSVKLGYFSQEQSNLNLRRSVLDEFRYGLVMYEDEARRFLSYFLFFGSEVFKRVGDLSYGERAKLVLAKMVMSGANFLVLDEPTNHMDYKSLAAVETALAAFQGSLLVVSHDRYFTQAIGINRVLLLEDGYLTQLPNGYEEYATMLKTA